MGSPVCPSTPHSPLPAFCHPCIWAHSCPGAVAHSGPAAWNAFPLDPPHDWLTSSFLQCHPLKQPSLPTPSSTAIPNSSYAPPCFISLINTYRCLTEYICNLFILLLLYFPTRMETPRRQGFCLFVDPCIFCLEQ